MHEFTLWQGKANLRTGIIKIAGNMKITNERILFTSLSKKLEIKMKDVRKIGIEGKLVKRLRIETPHGNYSFFMPHALDILSLIEKFIHR